LIVGALLCFQAGAARGQDTPKAPAQPAPPTVPAADISVRQRPALSPLDMLAQARQYRERMDQISHQLDTSIEVARRQKDIIQLNCVLDKAGQLKADIAIADSGMRNLAEAVNRRDDGGSAHEYTRITIVHQKAQLLASEAQACVGENLAYVGTTRVDVEVTGVPPEDFTNPPAPDHTSDRPPTASPYK